MRAAEYTRRIVAVKRFERIARAVRRQQIELNDTERRVIELERRLELARIRGGAR